MAKRTKLNGQYLMAFIDDIAVALATSCTAEFNMDTDTTATKDSGGWDYPEPVGGNWSVTSDGVVSVELTSTTDVGSNELLDLLLAGTQVELKWGRLSSGEQDEDGVPTGGWTPPTEGYKGSAIVTSISETAAVKEVATFSVTFTGQGKPEKYTTS